MQPAARRTKTKDEHPPAGQCSSDIYHTARLQAPGSSQVKFCKARLMQHLFSGLHRVERRDGPL